MNDTGLEVNPLKILKILARLQNSQWKGMSVPKNIWHTHTVVNLNSEIRL